MLSLNTARHSLSLGRSREVPGYKLQGYTGHRIQVTVAVAEARIIRIWDTYRPCRSVRNFKATERYTHMTKEFEQLVSPLDNLMGGLNLEDDNRRYRKQSVLYPDVSGHFIRRTITTFIKTI